MTWNDEDEDDDGPAHHETDGPDEAEMSDDPAEVPCPYCKREILEDSPQCPYCGCYLSREDAPIRREWWWFAAIVLLIALIFAFALRRW